MRCVRTDKQRVSCNKWNALISGYDLAGAARDNVKLITCVRLLQVRAAGRIHFQLQRPVFKHCNRAFALRSRQDRQGLGKRALASRG